MRNSFSRTGFQSVIGVSLVCDSDLARAPCASRASADALRIESADAAGECTVCEKPARTAAIFRAAPITPR